MKYEKHEVPDLNADGENSQFTDSKPPPWVHAALHKSPPPWLHAAPHKSPFYRLYTRHIMLSNSHLTQTDHHLTAAAVIMTKRTHSSNTPRVQMSSHWLGLNALGGTACNWPSYWSVSGYAKLAPAYRKYCRLRIVSEGVLTVSFVCLEKYSLCICVLTYSV